MGNEFLIATSDEFYYDGVPQPKINTYSEMTLAADTTGAASRIYCTVNTTLNIIRVILIIAIIICVIKGFCNLIANIKNKRDNKSDDEYDDSAYLKNHGVQKNKSVLGYFLASVIMAFGAGLINIITNFAAKPIIYIYPEEETEVKIKVKKPEKLTCTYPKYEEAWNVLAKPNGDLIDLKTNRKLYALYWEGINTTKANLKEGFIVEGENVAKFLEEKLEILGLTEREAEEFIVYWLPLMEKNKYNFIRFETLDEINENMELEIIPKPETLIRINMEFKGLSKPLNIKEQQLIKVERKGYTVVEWGGTKL